MSSPSRNGVPVCHSRINTSCTLTSFCRANRLHSSLRHDAESLRRRRCFRVDRVGVVVLLLTFYSYALTQFDCVLIDASICTLHFAIPVPA